MNRFLPVIFCMEVSPLSPGHFPLTSEVALSPGPMAPSPHLHNGLLFWGLVTQERCLSLVAWEGDLDRRSPPGPGASIRPGVFQDEKGLSAGHTADLSFSAPELVIALDGSCCRGKKLFGTEVELQSQFMLYPTTSKSCLCASAFPSLQWGHWNLHMTIGTRWAFAKHKPSLFAISATSVQSGL